MKMRFIALIGLGGLALLLAGCMPMFHQGPTTSNAPIALTPVKLNAPPPHWKPIINITGKYREGEIVVGYETEAALDQVASLVGGTVVDRIPQLKAALVQLAGLSVPEALGEIVWAVRKGELSGIRYAEPNYMRDLIEPLPEDQTQVMGSLEPQVYDPNADLRAYQWGLDAVDAEGAWPYATGDGIIVAVVDSGVDGTHPDLQGQVIGQWYDAWNESWETGYDSSWLYPGFPEYYGAHGTHVAGIIAAKDDGKGIVGLAPKAKILSIRIFSPDALSYWGSPYVGDFKVAKGIVEAVDYGAKVLNNSWGGWGYSQVIKAAIDYCIANGAVFVVAMGNSSMDDREYPAGYPGVIAVGATNAHDEKTDFSTTGGWISVGAPGERILSTLPTWWVQDGTGDPLLYDYWAGTSMATPFVSALAAMVLERHPTATPYQVKRIIETTADDIAAPGFDRGTGYGRINAAQAVGTSTLPPDGGYVEVYVNTASTGFPLPYMDITLRKDGIDRYFGQTDYEGWYGLGFPSNPSTGAWGVGAFYGIEPGTYEVIVGGEDMTYVWWARVANRVTAQDSITVGAGEHKTVNLTVNTTLQVTLEWDEAVDLDLAILEYDPSTHSYVWSTPKTGGIWGTFSPDVTAGGSETYTLSFPHWDYDVYYLGIMAYGNSSTARVTVVQNGVTEHYGPYVVTGTPSSPALYSSDNWPDWWENTPNPDFFGFTGPGGPIVY